ncbi:hypothetical protein ONZ45_g5882 [Pleurotus djamor]|nr:hypothetical protein ONZ45_g5882 [Pleurotus djamor]
MVSNWQKRNDAITAFGRQASLILPGLYLSDYVTAASSDEMKELGITHIVSIVDFLPSDLPGWIKHENRLHINLSDRFDCDIISHFEATTRFIGEALKENEGNKVMVHCVQGSVAYVRERRSIIYPNVGFKKQLETYEAFLAAKTVQSSDDG